VRSTGDGVAVVDVEATVPDFATNPVTVRVGSAGICASDLKMLPWKLPVTMGHEFAGVLDDGTVVTVQPNAPCGTCTQCVAGREHLCPESNHRIHGVFSDGGLADEVIVDRSSLVMLSPGVGPDVGALIEPISVRCAAHQGGLHGAAPPDRVLVIGGGSIGFASSRRAIGAAVDLVASSAQRGGRAARRVVARRRVRRRHRVRG
jgi:threonine dehydrogenase-like Zn-dependent dehydrogenase